MTTLQQVSPICTLLAGHSHLSELEPQTNGELHASVEESQGAHNSDPTVNKMVSFYK